LRQMEALTPQWIRHYALQTDNFISACFFKIFLLFGSTF